MPLTRPLATLLIALLVSACAGSGLPRQEGHAARVTIFRDDYGVPHVYGRSDADAVFGMLYAQAEDDFARVERNYIWALGRLSEIEGESAIYSDLRARMYMTEAEARQAYRDAPDWLRKLCMAFADGLNYYLATHPGVKPRLIERFEPWMPMYFFEGSIGGDIEQVPLARIEAFYGDSQTPRPAPDSADREPAGSNGFAISGKLTDSGAAMLLINPHTSFYFRPEIHVVSDEGLNAYGAVTWGQFFVYQGFNERTGWMHTSTYVDFMDEFVQDIESRNGRLTYRYGDERRPVLELDVVLKIRDGSEMKEKTFTIYRTHHGPITHEQDGRWVATRINWDPVNALRQSFLRTKQQDYKGFREVMDIRTNSSNNTVYADADGNIAYFHGNFVPRRNPSLDYSQPVSGSDPDADWQGKHPVDETIHLLNPANGWLQNCNSTPFTAAGSFSPEPDDYPPYMAPDPENFRGVHAVRLLTDLQRAGRDRLSLDELIALAYHPRLPAFEVLIPPLVESYRRSASRDAKLGLAISTLDNWDYTVTLESTALTLAHFYGLSVLNDGDGTRFADRKTWIEHYAANASPQAQVAKFQAVLEQVTQRYGSWRTPWGEINRLQRLDGGLEPRFDDRQPSLPVPMASARWGALAAFGARAAPNTRKLYGRRGNSFVAVVEFGERVSAKSLLAGGQSGDPGSPHFFDQGPAYAQRRFKPVAYYREDVESRAAEVYRPGERR